MIRKSKIIYILLIVFFVFTVKFSAEENEKPAFKLPEEIIMGKEKKKKKVDEKGNVQSKEKTKLKESGGEKLIPHVSINKRKEKILAIKQKEDKQLDIDLSAGNYNSLAYRIIQRLNIKDISCSFSLEKDSGNHTRHNSRFDHNIITGQFFGPNFDINLVYSRNDFDLPGEVVNPTDDSKRKSDDIKFGLTFKAKEEESEELIFIYNVERTKIKEKIDQENNSFDLKVLYNIVLRENMYYFSGEIKENNLIDQYNYQYYSFNAENRSLYLSEKLKMTVAIGFDQQEKEKIEINPKLKVLYARDHATHLESGLKRHSKLGDFYEMYGKDNYKRVNLFVLKPEGHWQIYGKVKKRINSDISIEAIIFHDWINNLIVFDQNESNPDGLWEPINSGEVKREGISISYSQKFFPRVSAQIDYTYLMASNVDGNKTVPGQPNTADARIEYDGEYFKMSVDGEYKSKRFYDQDRNEKIGGYGILGFEIEKSVSKKVKLYLNAKNILDKKYEIIKHYPGDRAKFIIGCHVSL